ncbi:zinc finger MYM-type 1-like [Paramuricea clavata]|uniref:Zinc finger MYM-type 1-like n=1 Tax=Paramuricea clavata TaxID=317549 RepID=A0A6S7FDS1_PARCT|nr:zinc finger MYM-type 1-like [Paramuricea clavata]
MEGTGSSKEPKERRTTAKKKAKTISDYFSTAPGGNERTIYYDPAQACVSQSVAQITRTPTRTSDDYQAASSPQVSPERHRVPTVVSSTLSKVHEPQAVIHVDPCKKTNISSYMNPHQPKNFEFPKRKFSGQNRSFQAAWFDIFSWLHYDEQLDSVLCFYCAQQNAQGNLRCASKKDQKFISDGFCNWKKSLDKFKQHESSECHKMAIDYAVNFPKNCGNVIDMTNEQSKKLRQTNRRCLLKIIENLQSLCRQGQAIQGDTDTESNFYQLMKLRGRDDPALLELLKKRGGDKYTSHDIQNEIIEIMAHEVQRDLIKDIGTGFFSIIADEYTDIGNKEQLTLCFRWVDEQLDGHEDFLGFYNIPNIASETIVQAIKDSLIRLQLSLSQCRGQCYDGASNMLGKKSGVAKQIQECEAKALPTHCHGHSLSLGVKDATNNCQILSNTMNNTNEIVKLVKYSPKRENLLGELKENLQYEDEEEEDAAAAGLTKFSATRWTVRAICFERVIDNYNVILKLWDECLKTKLPPDIRGRIIGCSTQMEVF